MRTRTATFPVFTLGRERLQDGKNFGYFLRYPLDILFPSDCSSARPPSDNRPTIVLSNIDKKKKKKWVPKLAESMGKKNYN